jgi:UTP--glucose-1-phosphate uridylyltransferase
MNPSAPVRKALIPLAGTHHASLALQTVLGPDARPVPVLVHQLNELAAAGIDEVGLIVSSPGRDLVAPVLEPFGDRVRYFFQEEPRGFGHALWGARSWVGRDPALVEVCDHLFLSTTAVTCVQQMVDAWRRGGAAVCAVQRVREPEVPRVGIVSGKRVEGSPDTYHLQAFLEKPSLTKAELLPHVSGLGSGEYLCAAGLYLFTPGVFDLFQEFVDRGEADQLRWLAPTFTQFMGRETFLGLEFQGRRINLEEPYGLLRAQVAMGLASADRDAVLSLLLEESLHRNRTGAEDRA